MMRHFTAFLSLCLLVSLMGTPRATAQSAAKGWQKQKMAKGLTLYTLDQSRDAREPQFVQVLKVGKKRSAGIAYSASELKPTSQFAAEHQALAAVNAGFFDMKNGGSVTYLKVDGQVISENAKENPLITQSAFVVTSRGKALIEPVVSAKYYSQSDIYADVLFTGPLLLHDGRVLAQDTAKTFVSYRHPRTAACTLPSGELLLVAADGRAQEAQGYSLPELAALLQSLDCEDAINFDGGGSTTLWVRKGERGEVVNHPSDNRRFDNQGERRVANIVFIK